MKFPIKAPARPPRAANAVANGLGWFSIALGVLELLAPRPLGRAFGLGRRPGLIRAYGAREIATGVGILVSKRPAPWIVARVAGDALDIGTLAPRLRTRRYRRNAAIALGAVAGVTTLDIANASALCAGERRARQPRRDYSERSGFPRPPDEMRGAARGRGAAIQTPAQPARAGESTRPPLSS